MDNELNGICTKFNYSENEKYLEFEIQDFVDGFDRRMMLLVSNLFILNSPKDMLDGTLLKKLVRTGSIHKFEKELNSFKQIFKLKNSGGSLRELKLLFGRYLAHFKKRNDRYITQIDKFITEVIEVMNDEVRFGKKLNKFFKMRI